jgi:two-component system, OmpR family, sensor kinase
MSRLSLRARLVLGVLALGAIGLVAADAVTYTSLRSFLLTRVDSTLEAEHRGAEQTGEGDFGPGGGTGNDYVEIRSSSGKVLYTSGVPHFPGTTAPSPPKLPATISGLKQRGPDLVRYFTVPAQSGGSRYRVRASMDNGSTNVLIIATSLSGVDSTLHRLLLIELFVSLAVLAGIVFLGLWIVRLGLRPLEAIGKTADQIAGGDLSHRVERAEPRTEVGRLGLVLNSMLDRIEASDRRLRRFVADASHELRTPLAAVRAYAELFERGADKHPDDLARAMTGISRESERMSELVEDLLLLARIDEGETFEREPVELADLAAEAVETARAVDPSRPIDLEVDPARVLGDRARLRRVLDNLLGNVRSHTPVGTPAHVRVRIVNSSAEIEVSDEGPGLPAGELDNVFRRFYRADASRSRDNGGVGLGLSIVAAIAHAHEGTVSATAAPGGGAMFTVTLPLLQGDGKHSASS